MTTLPNIDNETARRIFLARHGLGKLPSDIPLLDLITDLGFVQVDSINTVARAHDMILGARKRSYRPKHLKRLLERDRTLFEHWTHDASVIPTAFFPQWKLRFLRDGKDLRAKWRNWRRDGFEEKFETVLSHIRDHGPVSSRDVGGDESRSSGGWWDWHPSKTALEFLWRTGQLSVTRREGFQKVYDLTERVIPDGVRMVEMSRHEVIDWACNAALDRLGFATSGEIAAFWKTVTPAEAKDWCAARTDLIEVDIACADGATRRSLARPDILDEVPEIPGRLRVLSPFDPALRDRNRAERLFGFHYRIEVFVPEAKRIYGYYVFPVLEGTRLIGRIDMKRRAETGCLHVTAFWPERRTPFGKGRRKRLEAELNRLARIVSMDEVSFDADWVRSPR